MPNVPADQWFKEMMEKHASAATLRENIAAQCMGALLAYSGPWTGQPPEKLAKEALRHADALIRELAA
jgi:hypothetical protein